MIKLVAFALLLLLASCASAPPYNIDFEATSARLYVEAADGTFVKPFAGQVLDVDDIGLGREAIRLLPGRHVIRMGCPTQPEGILSAADWAPTVEYNFEAGKKYVVRCKDGALIVVERPG
jgi:hypothetical protein